MSPILAQPPTAGHSPLSPVAVSPWGASPLGANPWEESPLSANQPAVTPGRTSGPACPAVEELAKCVGASERIKTPGPASGVSRLVQRAACP